MNVVKGNLVAEFDENRIDLVLGLLSEAIEKLLTYHYPEIAEVVLSYVNNESGVERLKNLYISHNQRNGTLVQISLYSSTRFTKSLPLFHPSNKRIKL